MGFFPDSCCFRVILLGQVGLNGFRPCKIDDQPSERLQSVSDVCVVIAQSLALFFQRFDEKIVCLLVSFLLLQNRSQERSHLDGVDVLQQSWRVKQFTTPVFCFWSSPIADCVAAD